MSYRVPLREMRFVLHELAGLREVCALPGFEEVSDDLIDAVLEENARLVEAVVAPLNRVGDTEPPRWDAGRVTASAGFKEAFEAYADGGWQGLSHPTELGGQGLPKLLAAPVTESLNSGNLSFSLCPLLTDGVIEALSLVATAEQQARFIPPLMQGRWTGTMNLTEPQAGSDLALIRTRAVPQDDGSYRLSGQKIFITWGEHDLAENIVHLVLARTPDAPEGVKGITLFIVPKFLVDDAGHPGKRNDVYCASLEDKLGIHGSPTAVMLYGADKGEVGEGAIGYRVGEENQGLASMFVMMNAARYAVGLQGIALAERALQRATAYAHERLQGSVPGVAQAPVPIIRHPDVARMLGVMRGLTEGARAVAYAAAAAHDRARHAPDPATAKQARALHEYFVPIVKAFGTESAVEVTSLGIQVHGGMGYIEETGAAQDFRDARILPIYEGTTAIQANDFVGRKLLRDEAAVARSQVAAARAFVATLASPSAGQPDALSVVARRLEAAAEDYAQVLDFMLQAAARKDLASVYAGSVPCLMLAGLFHAGWQLARAAQIAAQRQAEGETDAFFPRKIETAVRFCVHVLPRTHGLRVAVESGAVLHDLGSEDPPGGGAS